MTDDIMDAVIKRARGYEARETVEEYSVVEGSLELVKKRVTTKDVPPDMAAAKILFDSGGVDELTDEQLETEKRRLLEELGALDKKTSARKKRA